ncbi:MAG: hypothetical protein KDA22_10735 [Phycisphaerales bacterium]|nr:hypothetical protein [Phycisphaerales bacterium]
MSVLRSVLRATVAASALAGGLVSLTACDTPQAVEPRAIRTADDLVRTLESGRSQIDVVIESLQNLRFGPADQRTANFRTFSSNLTQLDVLASSAGAEGRRMRQLGMDYFNAWTGVAARGTPDERRETAPRIQMADQRYQNILDFMTQLRWSFADLESDLMQIERSLPGNLTDQGLQAIDPIMSGLGLKAANTRNLIDRLVEQINAVTSARR